MNANYTTTDALPARDTQSGLLEPLLHDEHRAEELLPRLAEAEEMLDVHHPVHVRLLHELQHIHSEHNKSARKKKKTRVTIRRLKGMRGGVVQTFSPRGRTP